MKRFLIPAVLLAMLLGACQGNTPARTEEAVSSPTTLAYATQAVDPPGPTAGPTAAGTPVSSTSGASAGCTVVSPQPTPGPTEQSLFPPASDQDWVLGPETASITIIEYSDFQ